MLNLLFSLFIELYLISIAANDIHPLIDQFFQRNIENCGILYQFYCNTLNDKYRKRASLNDKYRETCISSKG